MDNTGKFMQKGETIEFDFRNCWWLPSGKRVLTLLSITFAVILEAKVQNVFDAIAFVLRKRFAGRGEKEMFDLPQSVRFPGIGKGR
mgnify:CR=1